MRKNLVRTYGILAILFVVFTVVVFAVPFVKNAVFWVSYLFVMLAIGVQGYAIHTAFSKEEPVTSKLYGFPVARIGFIYLVAQTITRTYWSLETASTRWRRSARRSPSRKTRRCEKSCSRRCGVICLAPPVSCAS